MKYLLFALLLLYAGLRSCYSADFMPSLVRDPTAIQSVEEVTRRGRVSQQFTLAPGACSSQPGWSDCSNDRERVELSQRKPYIELDQVFWAAWSIRLDPLWQDASPTTTVLAQFHHRDSGVPAVLFTQRDAQLSLRFESARAHWEPRTHPLIAVDHMRGQWTDLVVTARFSHDAARGYITVWVNGRMALDLRGVTTVGTTPIFFKYGIYRSYVSRNPNRATARAHYDEVRLGSTRALVDSQFNPKLQPKD